MRPSLSWRPFLSHIRPWCYTNIPSFVVIVFWSQWHESFLVRLCCSTRPFSAHEVPMCLGDVLSPHDIWLSCWQIVFYLNVCALVDLSAPLHVFHVEKIHWLVWVELVACGSLSSICSKCFHHFAVKSSFDFWTFAKLQKGLCLRDFSPFCQDITLKSKVLEKPWKSNGLLHFMGCYDIKG